MWTKDVQNVIFAILLCGWLGGMATKSKPAEAGRLLTIEEVGDVLNGKFARAYCYLHRMLLDIYSTC
jgi:hypothetical protein